MSRTLAQWLGIARYELLMHWRRGGLLVLMVGEVLGGQFIRLGDAPWMHLLPLPAQFGLGALQLILLAVLILAWRRWSEE